MSDLPSLPTLQDQAATPDEREARSSATFREQRDTARAQREEARRQRDDARRQRDQLAQRLSTLEARLAALGDGAPAPRAAAGQALTELDHFLLEGERARLMEQVRAKQAAGDALSVREGELLMERRLPPLLRARPAVSPPGKDVAFLTVANAAFLPGLEALLLSLRAVYPGLRSTVHVCHDGSLNAFVQARLRAMHPHLRFHEPDMSWFDTVPQASDNHRRIGALGYMNMEALRLTRCEHVVVLDSDILVTGDISAFWTGPGFKVCYDAGDREYVARSAFTGDWVFNSGIIGFPISAAGPKLHEEFRRLTHEHASKEVCPAIDRFADQKIWNILLAKRRKTWLPLNYNCNVKYLAKFLAGQAEAISVLHFAGPKPWNSKDYVSQENLRPSNAKALQHPRPWTDAYRALLLRHRMERYRAHAEAERRSRPKRRDTLIAGRRTAIMIGNGPSLARTDLAAAARMEKFAFNWFVLADAFDEIRPEHLVIGSHMFFGGWATTEPAFPPNYLERLLERRHRPALWCSFYFKDYLDTLPALRGFEVNYVLFEKPFKRFIDKAGQFHGDIDQFLDDGRTGVLSIGVPAALKLGFQRILLVGCDSNYNQPGTAQKYFYDMSQHTSLETREESLNATWTNEGRGPYVYRVVREALEARDVEFVDCTLDGALTEVRKGRLEDYAAPAPAPRPRAARAGAQAGSRSSRSS